MSFKKKDLQVKVLNGFAQEVLMRFNLTITPIVENLDILTEFGLDIDLITIGFQVRLDKLSEKEEKRKIDSSPRIDSAQKIDPLQKEDSFKF